MNKLLDYAKKQKLKNQKAKKNSSHKNSNSKNKKDEKLSKEDWEAIARNLY